MSLLQALSEFLSSAFARGVVKATDIAGTYDVRRGTSRPTLRDADDLATPTVADDVANMRGDFQQVGRDMRKALDKHPALAK